MAKHNLKLHIPQLLDECILQVVDLSVYDSMIPVSCPTLQILLPEFTTATLLNDTTTPQIAGGFSLNLTACDLEIQTENCGYEFNSLPDGIYVIKYSVSPNDVVFVEQNHLRITQALIQWKKLLCDLKLPACAPGADKKKRLAELMEIRGYLEAAVATVELCHKPKLGIEQYSYAVSLMDKMNCETC
jgi:hypothetical protein